MPAQAQQPAILHRRILATLTERIDSGEYPDGERLPPVRDLAREFAVNSRTVLKAVRGLEESGLVRRRPRVGVLVRRSPGPGAAVVGGGRDAILGFPLFVGSARITLRCCVTDYARCHQRMWRQLQEKFHAATSGIDLQIECRKGRPGWPEIRERYDLFSLYDWQLPHLPLGLVKHVPNTLRVAAGRIADPQTRAALGRLKREGTLVGVPYARFVPIMLGHADLLPADVSARFKSVWTWRELLEAANHSIKEHADRPLFLVEPFSLGLLLRNIEQLRVVLAHDAAAFRGETTAVLAFLMDYVRACQVSRPPVDSADVEARFFDRRVAAMFGGIAVLTACYDRQLDLDRMAIGFPPLLRADLNLPGAMVTMAVNANCTAPDAAEAFLRFLIAPDAQTILAEARVQLPLSARATGSEAFLAAPPSHRRVLPAIMKQCRYSSEEANPFAPGAGLGRASEVLMRLLEGGESPETAAEQIWAGLQIAEDMT